MFKINANDFQRTAATIVATLILTTVSVGAAVGPARAVETNPVYASVSGQPNA